MGNSIQEQDSSFNTVMNNLKKSKLSPKRLAIRPQQKYKDSLLQTLSKSNLSNQLKLKLKECINHTITHVEIIQTVSVIMMLLRNNISPQAYSKLTQDIESMVEKSKVESRHVIINFSPQKLKRYKPTTEQSAIKNGQKLKQAQNILRTEINKAHHPFIKLTKVFTDYITQIFLSLSIQAFQQDIEAQLQQFIQKNQIKNQTNKNNDQQQYENLLRKMIYKWCQFIADSCFRHYKTWIINYTGIPQPKYQKWVNSLILEQIWGVNQSYLFQIVSLIIEKFKRPLNIPQCHSLDLIRPNFFHIDDQLQISGNFYGSIFQMSQLPTNERPLSILNHLTNIKTAICTDIDNYYHLEQKLSNIIDQENKIIYEVNSDNILGIIAYILYRVKVKIQNIDRQCIFLRIVLGQSVYYSQGQSSYMLSTIVAAIEYLQSEEFHDAVKKLRQISVNNEENNTQVSENSVPHSINTDQIVHMGQKQNISKQKELQKMIF